ncbi:MAG: site-specific DNA-methyltransferase, partial [Anaerolineales bacterium]|nr:site-specific DNA-methyltransferase [Anaerolineales bacterium]
EQYLSKIKVIRRIAHKIIQFLEQLENFQKKLWLKKKFVVATSYCVAVGQIPETFYAEIVANEAQLAEWRSLLGLNKLMAETPLLNQGEISADTLRRYPTLMVDTGHFSPDFTTRLLHALSDLDEQTNGVLFHSDNFQALALIQRRYRKKIKCVYIDPPYNTDASPIVYKNGYRRSSWASLMEDRMGLDVNLRIPNSLRCIAIDDFEYANLCGVLESLADGVRHATVAVRSKPQGRPTATGFSTNHEYVLFWGDPDAKIGRLPRSGSKAERYPYSDELGIYAWANFRKSGTDSDRSDRPKSFYPVYAKTDSVRIPAMTWDEVLLRWRVTENPSLEEEVVWPIDSDNNEKVWTCSSSRAQDEIADIRVERDSDGHLEIYKKYRPNQDGALPGTWWEDSGYSASESGTKVLKDLFGAKEFDYPKSINLVVDCLRVGQLAGNDTVLDYFAGSGTTGHAVINLSREDNEQRRFVLVEMGDYFDTVLMPRLKKVTFTPEWKDGQPQRPATPEEAERSPRLFKVLRLESYEDTLNNLQTIRTQGQQSLLDRLEAQGPDGLREQYLLRYLLDVETRGSQSLLNIQGFNDPTAYKLLVKTPGSDESREVSVDLLETFNWLIGLTVRHIAMPQTFRAAFERDSEGRLRLDGHLKPDAAGPFWFRTVTGATPDGRETLIIWRKLTGNVEEDNLALDEWFTRQGYSSKDSEFDLIYVNGGNNLENLKAPDDTWKVRLIEEDFHRLMFTE